MRLAAFILLGCAALDLFMLALLLATVGVAYRSVRREAAAKGEAIPPHARDFWLLFGILLIGFLFLSGASLLLFSV